MHKDLESFYEEDPNFRICIASHSSTKALSIEEDFDTAIPHLNIKRLTGVESGTQQKAYFEYINETLSDTNVFIFILVIESGVDITIPVQKVYGVLCSRSNSQRAYMHMLASCRNVKDRQIDIANGAYLYINNNHNFWTYTYVIRLNKSTVGNTMRKNISVFNEVERLNKHPSRFVNYLKQLARSKGISFDIDEEPYETDEELPPAKDATTNYRLEAIRDAPNITAPEYEELVSRNNMGQTTTEIITSKSIGTVGNII